MSAATAPPVTRTGSGLPSRIIFHGVEGVGKSSFAAHAPAPIFLMTRGETGLLSLIDNGQLPETDHFREDAREWAGVMQALAWLSESKHEYRTLVIDTLNGAERLCFEHICSSRFDGSWDKFANYGKGPEQSLAEWIKLLSHLDRIREQRRMGIIALCHTRVKTYKNPEGDDYDRFSPDMHEKTWGQAHKWADIILFANHHTVPKKDRGELRAKGMSSGQRFIYTQRTAAWDAKSRIALPERIDMGGSGTEAWSNFSKEVKAGREAAKAASSTEQKAGDA